MRVVFISLFSLKESLRVVGRSGLSCSRPLSASVPWSIGSVGGGMEGGKRKVLKLLCQIEREKREREGLTETREHLRSLPPRGHFS